jgi:plasmid stabilization system protein ParE
MAEIAWTAEAQRWLEDIFEYIAADNPKAAARTVEGIYERAQDLKRFPQLGSRYAASSRHVRVLLYGHYRAVVSEAAASALLLHCVPRPPRRTLPR